MYGAFIGDIVGSKYEFHNIKTRDFPLFSKGCDYTDDTIMTVAVAKAIMLSRMEQFETEEKGRPFQETLVEVMRDFGRRYPNPTGAYGGSFLKWLSSENPKPYYSFGNGSAMRVAPCGLAAVELEEALALARASASVTHNHPEGIKGAEAVAAAIFLAKCHRPKEEIRQYITEHYYNLDFTLDSIRESYRFDVSCQGSVPQAIVAFLESESFEDAIRNVISIGGDCDTTGAITGSIAWAYYDRLGRWYRNEYVSPLMELKEQAEAYLPKEFIEITDEFCKVCEQRAGTNNRMGGCTGILNRDEFNRFWINGTNPADPLPQLIDDAEHVENKVIAFCQKYIVLMELLYQDQELNQWCRDYSSYKPATTPTHEKLRDMIYALAHDADAFSPAILKLRNYSTYSLKAALAGTATDLMFGIAMEIRLEYSGGNYLFPHAIADGKLYRLMDALLRQKGKRENVT